MEKNGSSPNMQTNSMLMFIVQAIELANVAGVIVVHTIQTLH